MRIEVDTGLFAGDLSGTVDMDFLADSDIRVIINLTGMEPEFYVEDTEYYDDFLPEVELFSEEVDGMVDRLNKLAMKIRSARMKNENVYVCCTDAKNNSMLLIAYYLIKYCGRNPQALVKRIETIYFSQAQLDEEAGGTEFNLGSRENLQKRNEMRCLTIMSSRNILLGRLAAAAKTANNFNYINTGRLKKVSK
jgi:hypothetical protein